MNIQQKNRGFIKILLLILLIVVIASALQLDLRGFYESESFQKNFSFAVEKLSIFWDKFLLPTLKYTWANILEPFVFTPLRNVIGGDNEEEKEEMTDALPEPA